MHQGHVAIRQFRRLPTRRDHSRSAATSARDVPPSEDALDEQIRRARIDRDQADAALTGVIRRLEDLGHGEQRQETTKTRDSWQHVIADLDRELVGLRAGLQARSQLDPPRRAR